uniref:hypothetical protein n=1 Tax=Algoriphagus sp. TaxID=1872435 RepID=UPI0040488AAD
MKKLFLFLFLHFIPSLCFSQINGFTNATTTANGLGNNIVYAVYASGSTVYAATEGGLAISTDGGASFTNRTTANGLGSNAVLGVYASGSTVYATTIGGLGVSTDGGASFTNKTIAAGLLV